MRKILSVLLFAGMCAGLVSDAYGQGRRQRIKNKWKATFGTPRNPKRPPRPPKPHVVAPPPPPAPKVVAPPPPPKPPRPPKPPLPR